MSLRYASRLVVQGGMRVKDHASKSLKEAASSAASSSSPSAASSSSRQVRKLTSALDSASLRTVAAEKRRKAEESLRTVMYLSCWGPN